MIEEKNAAETLAHERTEDETRCVGAVEASDVVEETGDEDHRTYELALALRERSRGFAALLQATFEHGCAFDYEEMRGVARLACDLADSANEAFNRVRNED